MKRTNYVFIFCGIIFGLSGLCAGKSLPEKKDYKENLFYEPVSRGAVR